MIERTFCHLPRITLKKERILWELGFTDWDSVLQATDELPPYLENNIERVRESKTALDESNLRYFKKHLPRDQQWRLFKRYQDSAVYLDIETTMQQKNQLAQITCIGLFDGATPSTFTPPIDPDQLSTFLNPFKVIVTFNGKSFDVPLLKGHYPTMSIPPIHLDLRLVLKDLGYSGGLKSIEKQVGIIREGCLTDIDGYMAVLLWKKHLSGDERALPTLIRYNLEDVVNLEHLMILAYNQFCKDLGWAEEVIYRKPVFPLDHPYDEALIQELKDFILRKVPNKKIMAE